MRRWAAVGFRSWRGPFAFARRGFLLAASIRPSSINLSGSDWHSSFGVTPISWNPAVLFFGVENSSRSQIAEGLLRSQAGHLFDVHSAGTVPAERVHPLAVQVMAEVGIDISSAVPKTSAKYLGRLPVRHLIIVCDNEEKQSPRIFPGALTREFWPLKNPRDFEGPSDELLVRFRQIRDELTQRILEWLSTLPVKSPASQAQLVPGVGAARNAHRS